MTWLGWCLAQAGLVLAAVLVVGNGIGRRLAALTALMMGLVLPWFAPPYALLRAVLAAAAMLALVKVLQVALDPDGWPTRRRLWHSLAPFDIASTNRAPPGVDRALLAGTLLHAVVAGLAFAGLWQLDREPTLGVTLVRMGLGIVLVYTAMEAVTEALRFVHRLAGVAVPPIQRMPIASRSIREFWSERWNLPVSGWLEHYVFRPVSQLRGVEWGLVASFVVSALLHAYMFLVAAGWLAAFMGGAFFLFQALFVLVESTIGMRRRSQLLQRLWTLGLLLLSAPLFVEPVLQVLGV